MYSEVKKRRKLPEDQQVITVRLPKDAHGNLLTYCKENNISINRICQNAIADVLNLEVKQLQNNKVVFLPR